MTDSEIEEQLFDLLWSYRDFHLSDLGERGLTADEQISLQNVSKLAWDTFRAAFGSQEELTEAYLRDSSDGAEERIQQQIRLWASLLEWPGNSHQCTWLESAETVEEYHTKMERFLVGSLSPFIKVIR